MTQTTEMTTIYDNGLSGDTRVILEQDADGLLYETTNASTRQLVCSALFAGWKLDEEWLNKLADQFGSREIAERYYAAATDADK